MILTCEKCETRFRLDESRLPAKGARVRCSRCKHAFLVKPPGVPEAKVIEELAAEAARTAKPAQPDVAWDLEESSSGAGSTIQRGRTPQPAAAPSEIEDESEWRFESEVPELGDSGASLDLPNGEAPAPPAEPDPNESSFAQLGDPESWDLLSTSGQETAPPARQAIGRVRPVSVAASALITAPPIETRPPVAIDTPPAVEVRNEPARLGAIEPEPPVRLAAFAAMALLAALVVAGGLRSPSAPMLEPPALAAGPLAVEKLHARLVDNLWAGPVWVVSGELHNATSEPQRLAAALDVVLLDREGVAIEGAAAIAQPAISAARLHAADPLVLHEEASVAAAALAGRALAPDARVAFDAVFATAPGVPARFALATR